MCIMKIGHLKKELLVAASDQAKHKCIASEVPRASPDSPAILPGQPALFLSCQDPFSPLGKQSMLSNPISLIGPRHFLLC